jgi:hypothetical protein
MDMLMGLLLVLIVLFCACGSVLQYLESRKNKALDIRNRALDAEDEAERLAEPAEYFLREMRLVSGFGWWLILRYHGASGWAATRVFIPYGHPAEHKVRDQYPNRLRLRFNPVTGANPRQVASYLDVEIISRKA